MPDESDGITMMRARMTRARRVPPPARKPAAAEVAELTALPVAAPDPGPAAEEPPAVPQAVSATRPRRGTIRRRPAGPVVGPEDRVANLAIRVRQPLDDHLAEVIHAFRREGVRTSKVELIEMLLWELPADPAAIRERLAAFRDAAPRSAPLAG